MLIRKIISKERDEIRNNNMKCKELLESSMKICKPRNLEINTFKKFLQPSKTNPREIDGLTDQLQLKQ